LIGLGASELAIKEYEWFLQTVAGAYTEELADFIARKQFAAISADKTKAADFGINTDNTFDIWDFVGENYSVWSASGLPLVLAIGYENYKKFLTGAYEMDKHFINTDYEDNIPVHLAMTWLWNNNFMKFAGHAVVPYGEDLELFPKYVRNLITSLSRRADVFGNIIDEYSTGPAVLDESGTNNVPVDGIAFLKSSWQKLAEQSGNTGRIETERDNQAALFGNFMARMQLLAFGIPEEGVKSEIEKEKNRLSQEMRNAGRPEQEINEAMADLDRLAGQMFFDGNIPSTAIIIDELTPENLGSLMALYEHMIMAMSIILRVNPYDDQTGRDFKKSIAGRFLDAVKSAAVETIDLPGHFMKIFVSAEKAVPEQTAENERSGSAIMEHNLPKVFAWLAGGNSALTAALKLALIEFFPSIFSDFAGGHREKDKKTAAVFEMFAASAAAAGVFAVMAALLLPVSSSAIIMTAALSMLGVFLTNITVHVAVDYKYIRKIAQDIDSLETIETDRARISKEENLEVFIINERPDNAPKYGFINTGFSADGHIIWLSRKTGKTVLFAENAEFNSIAAESDSIIPVVLNKKGANFEISPIAVDDDPLGYMKDVQYLDGLIVVQRSYYDNILKLSGYDAKMAGEKIRDAAEAEKSAFAHDCIMDLSNIAPDKIRKAIEAFNKSGNKQIAVPYEFFAKQSHMPERETVSAIVGKISENGTRVFAVADEVNKGFEEVMLRYGFAGYIIAKDGKVNVKDFYATADNRNVSEIKDFNTTYEMLAMINNAEPDSVKLVNIEKYLDLLTSERDIDYRVKELVGVFGSKAFKFFMSKSEMTAEHAVNTALEYKMSNIPSLGAYDFTEITEILKSGASIDGVDKLAAKLKVSGNPGLTVFMTRIEQNAKDPADVSKILEIKFAFLKTIAQKAKVKADIYDDNVVGLKDKNLERYMTLCALSGYDIDNVFISDFEKSADGMKADAAYSYAAARALSLVGEKAEAATMYEFLRKHADRERKITAGQNKPIDARLVAEILKAA
ncbi:MAG: hypothetical protein FWH43_07530, partial [Endomicrobia bacterium]|nr:hypothetical protein [Endomicrobiia bacterium]